VNNYDGYGKKWLKLKLKVYIVKSEEDEDDKQFMIPCIKHDV